jgi:hypothetical protein
MQWAFLWMFIRSLPGSPSIDNVSLSRQEPEGQSVETLPAGRDVVADRDHGRTLGLSKLKVKHKIVMRDTRL